MDIQKFRECKTILFDFGGTLDSDGDHWLDRFYQLYEQVGLDLSPSAIKRAFYHADTLCYGDSRLVFSGLRPLMKHYIHLQFEALNLEESGKEKEMADIFCNRSEPFLCRNAFLLNRIRHL
jgi:hypothetical protein